jgi:cyclic pyranopterin phosphate synthase
MIERLPSSAPSVPAAGDRRRRTLPLLTQAPRPVPRRGTKAGPPPRSVRISVTDRCDFACTYCRPAHNEGYADGRLLPQEWRTMFDALRRAGIRRVRLTGGEPLLVPNIVEIVAHLSSLGFDDLALTTNASQLERLAVPLRSAGLHRINVSLDTLDAGRFRAITRGGSLARVLAGIDAAQRADFSPIKLNTVVLRGHNDDELESILLWAWSRGMVPRFLEVMPIAEGAKLVGEHLVTAAAMRAALSHHLLPDEPLVEPGLGPAKYVRARSDPTLRVGFISGTSDTFCDACDRLRVSSTGVLRPCLATDDGVDAADLARSGDAAGIADRIGDAWALKPDGDVWKGCTEATAADVSMRAIGG